MSVSITCGNKPVSLPLEITSDTQAFLIDRRVWPFLSEQIKQYVDKTGHHPKTYKKIRQLLCNAIRKAKLDAN
jgi:hypothetical protein